MEEYLIDNGIPVPVAEQVAALLENQDGHNEEWLYELAKDFIKREVHNMLIDTALHLPVEVLLTQLLRG